MGRVAKSKLARKATATVAYRRLDEAKRLLLLGGVDPKVVEETFKKALSIRLTMQVGCPRRLANRLWQLMGDERTFSVMVLRHSDEHIEIMPMGSDRKPYQKGEHFTPANWSMKKGEMAKKVKFHGAAGPSKTSAGEGAKSNGRVYRTFEEKTEILAYAKEHGAASAGKKFGVSGPTIYTWKSRGVKAEEGKRGPHSRSSDSVKSQAIAYAKTTSQKKAAVKFGVSQSTVGLWMRKAGIGMALNPPKKTAKVKRAAKYAREGDPADILQDLKALPVYAVARKHGITKERVEELAKQYPSLVPKGARHNGRVLEHVAGQGVPQAEGSI